LEVELEALCELGYAVADLAAFGFDDAQLAALSQIDGGTETDPDAIPEPPDEPVTQPGDLWVLGEHRLLCGDSSLQADVDRLCEGKPVHLLHTDPPYNVAVEPRSNN